MWVENITLSNIKCFREEKIIFTYNSATSKEVKPYLWITLLGENGVGKSTLLQALALLLAGPEAAKELLPRPTGWVSDSSKPGKLSAVLHQDELDAGTYGKKQITKAFSYSYFVTGDTPTTIKVGKDNKETYTEPALIEENSRFLSWLRTNAFASNTKGWFAVGYGAFRRLNRINQSTLPSLDAPKRSNNFRTQFDEDKPISSFEQWMVHLDFRIAKGDNEAIKKWEIGVKVIESLLPGDAKIAEVTTDGQIKFLVNGRKVPTIGLSDGYRSVIALAG